ncbi:MAG: hypothetical protein A3E80_01345 [Chlamydiae bacterium RIFCSPHIGHO2_12_FULL_49_9]|nr:MAG: hypothetical protein A3E80_01345 [Chlamydiae bacterium RIFCSPHIGHO2_12_FULL_49_9]
MDLFVSCFYADVCDVYFGCWKSGERVSFEQRFHNFPQSLRKIFLVSNPLIPKWFRESLENCFRKGIAQI